MIFWGERLTWVNVFDGEKWVYADFSRGRIGRGGGNEAFTPAPTTNAYEKQHICRARGLHKGNNGIMLNIFLILIQKS